ncbi:uncharacterized protein LOC131627333 isoform X2 [Vicia villosa]|uniref:uncharacterized protein LOC131627333 isoform X2 n=1 Tax=Vicia villosa TaxID=3911 RepID=UPI00273CCE78|nr:uncharacterized protein LOC131627333 isoform X2 [Vicia villosa]
MATETLELPSDPTHQEFVKQEKDEAIAEKINSLANEDGDKPEGAQVRSTPSSTTEGDEVKAELAAAEIKKGDDSSALKEFVKQEKDEAIAKKINSLANEDGDKPEEAQGQATPSTTEGDEVKAELVAAEIVKDDNSSTLKEFVKPEKDEAIAEKIDSLANEDGDKPDDTPIQATPSSTTGDEVKAELASEAIEKGDDSSALKEFVKLEKDETIEEKINSLANEDGDKPDHSQGQATPTSEAEDEVKAELTAVEIEKGDDSSALKEFVKQEKDEAISETINSLANEDGDKPEDGQGQATPSSTTEGDEVKAELASKAIEKGDDSSSLKEFVKPEKDEAIAEKIDSLAKEDGGKPDDAQDQATPSSTTEGDEAKAELAAAEIETGDDSSALKEFVKLEKDEAIAEKINSLANEDGFKPDDSQGQATPSSTTEGDEVKAELAAAEIEKGDDSSAFTISVEDILKQDIVDESQNSAAEKGDEEKAELASSEIEKSDDSSALKVSIEDSPKPDIVDDAPNSAVEKVDEEKAELPVPVEKTDDSVPIEPVAVADIAEEEKNPIPESQPISVAEPVLDAAISQQDEPQSTETDVKETQQTIEKKPVDEENKSKTGDVPEAEIIEKSVDTTESSSDATETNQSEVAEVKHAEISETGAEKVTEPVATKEREVTQEPEKESQEKSEEAEQPSTIAIVEPSAEANEEKISAAIAEETNNTEVEKAKAESVVTEVEPTETKKELVVADVEPTGTVKDEPAVTEVEENQKEPKEEEQPNTSSIPEQSAETNDVIAVEEKTRELEFEAAILKDTNNDNAGPTETEKAEPVVTQVELTETVKEELVVAEVEPTETVKDEPAVTEVEENQKEPKEEEKPNTYSIPEQSAETNDVIAVEEKTRELEFAAATLKDTNNDNAESTETEKAEPVVTQAEPTDTVKEELVVAEVDPTETVKEEPAVIEIEENQKEPEQQSTEPREDEQLNASSIPEQSTETNNVIAVEEKTRELEFEATILKETNNNNVGPTETEKAEPVVTEVDESQGAQEIQSFKQEEEAKPKEKSESQEQIGDTVEVHPSKDSDIDPVKEAGNSELEAIPVKEENIDSLSNGVEEKPREQLQIGEEVVETIKVVEPEKATQKSEESIDGTIKNSTVKEDESETNTTVNTEQVSLNEEAQTKLENPVEPSPEVEEKTVVEDVKKEVAGVTENATSVDEKVDVAAENVKKEPEAPDAVQVSSRETEVEIKKAEEQNEAKTDTPEAGKADTKVDEISKAVSEPVRETLASKFEEKDEEEKTIQTGENNSEKEKIEEPVKTEVEATKENDTTTVTKDLPKETPAKPAQKQSNNIISKVKQSLVKAKKAITGKSPSSKNLNSDQKGDIKVK